MTEIEVVDNTEDSCYEIRVDGQHAGKLEYRLIDGERHLPHTEIDREYGGRGLGSRLVEGALQLARESGEPVVPECPFVVAYLHKHPQWQDILVPGSLPPADD